ATLQHLVFRITASSGEERQNLQAELLGGGHLLGLLGQSPAEWFHRGIDQSRIEDRIAARAAARRDRRFADADGIRAELAAEGIVLEDRPDGDRKSTRLNS